MIKAAIGKLKEGTKAIKEFFEELWTALVKWLDELFGINTAAQRDVNELLRQVDDLFDAQGGKLLNATGLKLLKAQLWEKYTVPPHVLK